MAERDELRHERKRERERERRLENKDGKRSKMTRDAERDVSERIALGQAVPNSTEVGEPLTQPHLNLPIHRPLPLHFQTLFDQRLFNQSASGMNSGFSSADDQ